MSSPLAVPPDLIRDPIARIAADGRLEPCTPETAAWLATVADHVDRLPLDDDQRARLRQGDEVVALVAGRWWSFEQLTDGGRTWLRARDVDDRERRAATVLATARCRRLAALAASLAHDLGNQLNAALALSAAISPEVEERDRTTLREFEQGTKLGSRMVRTLARLLSARGRKVEVVEPADLLADALSLVQKSYDLADIDLVTEVPCDLPVIRVMREEAVQAIMDGLMALQSVDPETVRVTAVSTTRSIADDRERASVVLRCHAASNDAAAIEALLQVVTFADGSLARIARDPATYAGLGGALFMQRRVGGDLVFARDGEGVVCEYVWPAVRSVRGLAR
ncbi:MAG TPA: hypothetical protein ENI87_13555 [bacterium]|nr:hypothetical protein [bacterium]